MVEIKLKNSDNSWDSIPELKGTDGNVGVTPNITFNTISGSTTNVTQSGTPENLQVNLTIPNGVSGIIPNESSLAKKSGNLGSLGGYNTPFVTANALTVTQVSKDNNQVTGAVTITVRNGMSNTEWVKSVMITNPSASVSLGSNWIWSGGTAPTLVENSLLVLHWCNDIGVANLVEGAEYLRTYTGTITMDSDAADHNIRRNNVILYHISDGTHTVSLAVGDVISNTYSSPNAPVVNSATNIEFTVSGKDLVVASLSNNFSASITMHGEGGSN